MIGSLVYYVLFPLTRFINSLSGRVPKHDPLKERTPDAFMNGQDAWGGGGVPQGRCTAEKAALLTRWPGVGRSPWQQSEEAEQEEQEEEEVTVTLEERLVGVVHVGEDRVGLAKGRKIERRAPEQEVGSGREVEGGWVQAKEVEQWTDTAGAFGLEQTAVGGAGGRDSDPWAEAAENPWSGGSCSVLDLRALLSDTSAPTWLDLMQPPSAAWHFSNSSGLGGVVPCQSWQSAGRSYYPLPQESVHLEVAWRVWEDLSEPWSEASTPPALPFDFTVMSYNVLAQDLLEANPQLYGHCPPVFTAWEFRFRNILQQFQKWEPDVLCLQEVQANHFIEQFQPGLSALGYNCVYKRRTGTKSDGCATCYRKKRFSQGSVRLVEFYRPGTELLDRDNVAVVLLLHPVLSQGPPVCVANTHLLFNPRRGDVKLTQLVMLLAEIDRMAGPRRCPVLLCGDFNALPSMPLYQLITTGKLYYHGLPAWMISGQEDLSYKMYHRRLRAPLWPSALGISDNCQYVADTEKEKSGEFQYSRKFLLELRFCDAACVRPVDLEQIPGVTDATPDPLEKRLSSPRSSNPISHGLSLRSAYSHFTRESNRPEVTTLHAECGATVDYIFYSGAPDAGTRDGGGGHLKLIGRLALLSEEDLWSMNGLPNEIFSSDHLCLLAQFRLDGSVV